MNEYIAIYKQAAQGQIQKTYEKLLRFVMSVKAHFSKTLADRYEVGNLSPGYMDYSYFPFFDASMRKRKLRFGLVLNHREVRFELWLMGQNAAVQQEYWALLKDTPWNKGKTQMPQYSVLEAVVAEAPDFEHPQLLAAQITTQAAAMAEEIMAYIDNAN